MSRSLKSSFIGLLVVCSVTVSGCASIDSTQTSEPPDIRFLGAIAPGDIRGERSSQVLGALEVKFLQAFPKASWSSGNSKQADVLVDMNVFSAKTTDTRSSQELRHCRRWSEPDRDAKGALQRLISRNCLDWQVQQIPCLTRNYEVDVQIRARQRTDDRVIASDRKVFMGTDRQCGDKTPATAVLQAQAESQVAAWATNLLRAPLAALVPSQQAATAISEVRPATQAAGAVSPPPEFIQTPSAIAPVEAHALVIGNANYPGSAKLANPVNDAVAISRKLADLGFQVTRIDDGDRDTLVKGLSQFQQKAATSQVTVLYYSGHGMQIDGVNYLLPVNIDVSKPATFKLQALPVDTVIDTYMPGRTRVVFLDACRDNPSIGSSVRGFSRGLAPIQAPAGTLIAYATRDGGVAEDGTGKHSPFTMALLDLISEPEDISLILRRVRDRVMRDTSGRQQPWEYGSLSGGALVFSRLARP